MRCEPQLKPEDLKALEETLIETRDLSGFVVTLRKRFKDHLKK